MKKISLVSPLCDESLYECSRTGLSGLTWNALRAVPSGSLHRETRCQAIAAHAIAAFQPSPGMRDGGLSPISADTCAGRYPVTGLCLLSRGACAPWMPAFAGIVGGAGIFGRGVRLSSRTPQAIRRSSAAKTGSLRRGYGGRGKRGAPIRCPQVASNAVWFGAFLPCRRWVFHRAYSGAASALSLRLLRRP